MMVLCAGCEKPIFDRYLHHVIDKAWHAACVTCTDCKLPLKEKCFSRDGRLYCRNDFLKRYGTKCAGCQRVIQMTDLVRRAREKVFHVACFRCMTCQKQLDTGEELYIINGCKFLCKNDYLNSRHPYGAGNSCLSECGSDDGDDDDLLLADEASLLSSHGLGKDERTGDSTAPASHLSSRSTDHSPSSPESMSSQQQSVQNRDQSKHNSSSGADENNGGAAGSGSQQQQGGAKRRGPRTTIKAKQLETLKAAFAATPKPTRHIREQLAQETGLNMRVIQVWFQNRRSKERRMKQLRYGSFRPGSRRSRNALLRDDPSALMGGAGALFADGLRRHADAYYSHPNYYCDMFPMGPDHLGESPSNMGMVGPPGGAFMIPHPDDAVVSMEGHGPEGQFMMDDQSMRRGVSPENRGMPGMPANPVGQGGAEEAFRNHHGFAGALLPTNDAGMGNW